MYASNSEPLLQISFLASSTILSPYSTRKIENNIAKDMMPHNGAFNQDSLSGRKPLLTPSKVASDKHIMTYDIRRSKLLKNSIL